jgi:hypothetical protein
MGPTAQALADGRWVAIPQPPITLCDPLATVAGSDLYVVESGLTKCNPAAAVYHARTNRWTRLPSLPPAVGNQPALAWAGDRLVVVARKSGATFAYQPGSTRWSELAALPTNKKSVYSSVDLLWTGDQLFATVADGFPRTTATATATARTYALTANGGRWAPIAEIGEPKTGTIIDAQMATYDNSVYSLVDVAVSHDNPHDSYISGSVTLDHLTHHSWRTAGPTINNPKSAISLMSVAGAILATGSECPGLQDCTEEAATATLIRPGEDSTHLDPPLGTPYPRDIAAGAGTIVVTYPNGPDSYGSIALPGHGPKPGTTALYDINTKTWLKGPLAPTSSRTDDASTYWTVAGTVMLDTTGGWLLQPTS